MKKMTSAEIREAFLSFYERQGHTREKSSSLVPANDPTLLFTSAGMVQFKDVFMGTEKRSYVRATTAQKCLRAGGKHNDLENVGFTGRHHTFFEMLGNFSFGDYFKKEAIKFAWEFVTKELGLPKDRLYVTIFREDDEAYKIWHEQEGVAKDRILRFDEKDNFWSAGDVGPCGPCTEIYFDQGEAFNTGDPDKDKMGGDGDRFLEFYNLVFMQYNRDAQGNLSPLPRPSVDTGMGLERITAILQGAASNYDTDGFQKLIQAIAQASGKKYKSGSMDADSVAMRVIADHVRAISFLIADGVLPSNEGRGYVLRRILRRAVRFGKNLGFTKSFLADLVPALTGWMGPAYPELKEKEPLIRKAVRAEEENFLATLERGLSLLDEKLAAPEVKKSKILSGEAAFLLYDSFGFPLDLTRLIAREKGFAVDEAGFDRAMEKQKSQSKVVKAEKSGPRLELYKKLAEKKFATAFTGYKDSSGSGKLLALLQGDAIVETADLANGKAFEAVFDSTPFYAEGGGQVGDEGELFAGSALVAKITGVKKPLPNLMVVQGELVSGAGLKVGQKYEQKVAAAHRALVKANHTATHLMHWALKKVLGGHVKQAGSLVNSEFTRFDFTHFEALKAEEIQEIERLVNAAILNAEPVSAKLMAKDDAIASGAVALFGEKYDDEVRVLKIGDGFSTELCGGTHVDNTAQIGLFVIESEGGIAAGVRRITALTNAGALAYLQGKARNWDALRERLKASSDEDVHKRVDSALTQAKDLEKKMGAIQAQNAGALAKDIVAKARQVNGVKFVSHNMGEGGMDALRVLGERVRDQLPSGVAALGTVDSSQGKAFLLVLVSPDLTKTYNAGKIVQAVAPLIDGKGGGKPEQAQAGGGKTAALPDALEKVAGLLS